LVLLAILIVGATGVALALYRNGKTATSGSAEVCTNGATTYPNCDNNACQYGGTFPNCTSSPSCQYGGTYPNCNPPPSLGCKGMAACFKDNVAYIVDGDTLDVGDTRIRLALVNTPEVGQAGYQEAKVFTAQTCAVGSQAVVDEDDGQTGGSYGRMIAVVYCGGVNLNAALLQSGLAELLTYYCSVSEFATENWTGCP